MKTNSATSTRRSRTSGFLSPAGHSVLLLVMLGLLLLSVGWRAAHRYAATPPAGLQHVPLPHPDPTPLSPSKP